MGWSLIARFRGGFVLCIEHCECPEYRGGLISGVDLYYRAHIGTF